MNSHEYEAASQAMRDATAIFREAQDAYRSRKIGDAEFIAARKVYNSYVAEFDSAYEAEQNS